MRNKYVQDITQAIKTQRINVIHISKATSFFLAYSSIKNKSS